MLGVRVFPSLLLQNRGLVKTVRFKDPTYLGDPINIVRIFNEKEIDELVLLDIQATVENRPPQWDLLADIASECFVPLGYGGGIRSVAMAEKVLELGFEKVILNSCAVESPTIIEEAARRFGSQSVVASIDVKERLFGRLEVMTRGGRQSTKLDPIAWARQMEAMGAGEILLNSIDRDGTMKGYDIHLIRRVSSAVRVPVVACGGAHNLDDFVHAVRDGGASAVAAGSMFVFQGPHRAVLITFPTQKTLAAIFPERASECSEG